MGWQGSRRSKASAVTPFTLPVPWVWWGPAWGHQVEEGRVFPMPGDPCGFAEVWALGRGWRGRETHRVPPCWGWGG